MSFLLADEFGTPLVDNSGQVTAPWQKKWSKMAVLKAISSQLAGLNAKIVVGGLNYPAGASEPVAATGIGSGYSLDDRDGTSARWVIYANAGVFHIWNSIDGDVCSLPVGSPGFITPETSEPPFQTLTDGATVTWDFSNYQSRSAYLLIGGNRTLAINNCNDGAFGTLLVQQDATGGRTLALPSGSKVIGGGAGVITLTATAGAIDILSFVQRGSTLYWNYGLNYT